MRTSIKVDTALFLAALPMKTVSREQFVASIQEHEIGNHVVHTAFRSVMFCQDAYMQTFASAEYAKPVPLKGAKVVATFRVAETHLVEVEDDDVPL